MTKNNSAPGLAQAISANRNGVGISSSPPLPPGIGLGSGVPRPKMSGAPEANGAPPVGALEAIMKSLSGGGGGMPPARGRGSVGPRGPEKPSLGRSNAISRRLNGNPSKGTELKGL